MATFDERLQGLLSQPSFNLGVGLLAGGGPRVNQGGLGQNLGSALQFQQQQALNQQQQQANQLALQQAQAQQAQQQQLQQQLPGLLQGLGLPPEFAGLLASNPAAQAALLQAAATPEEIDGVDFNDIRQTRNDILRQSEDFMQQQGALIDVIDFAKAGTPTGDMALIFKLMKLLDPRSTVREGEAHQAGQTTGVPGQIINAYNRAIEGVMLNPQQRNDFVMRAFDAWENAAEGQERVLSSGREFAEAHGMDPSQILPSSALPLPLNRDDIQISGAAPKPITPGGLLDDAKDFVQTVFGIEMGGGGGGQTGEQPGESVGNISGQLMEAINRAKPGDVVELPNNVTFTWLE